MTHDVQSATDRRRSSTSARSIAPDCNGGVTFKDIGAWIDFDRSAFQWQDQGSFSQRVKKMSPSPRAPVYRAF